MADASAPAVSVVLPTRNRADTLRRAAGSVLRQTFDDWELVIVDDASLDATPAVIRELEARDARVRGLRNARPAGGAGARNTGLRAARGRLVAFLDDDAEWLPRKLERQLALVADGADALVYGPVMAVEEDGSTSLLGGPVDPADPLAALAAGNRIDTSGTLIARHALDAVDGFDPELPRLQDWDLWLRLAARVPFLYHADVLARTFRTGERISTNPTALPEAAARMARTHAGHPELLATLGHMLLQEGHARPGRRLLAEAARTGAGGPGLHLRRLLARASPGAYAALAGLAGRIRRRRPPAPWPHEATDAADAAARMRPRAPGEG